MGWVLLGGLVLALGLVAWQGRRKGGPGPEA